LPAGPDLAELAERIDALLPQTQCTRCGYAACKPYAQAIAQGQAGINRCAPGGAAGIGLLSNLLGLPAVPLEPSCGTEGPVSVAWIDPQACIGCARCLPVCPVDAILGAQHWLHTVLPDECTGCELCIAACPVDCIHMHERATEEPAPLAASNRERFERHRERTERAALERARLLDERKRIARSPSSA
jgi:electron transport complex protein RnfB